MNLIIHQVNCLLTDSKRESNWASLGHQLGIDERWLLKYIFESNEYHNCSKITYELMAMARMPMKNSCPKHNQA